RAGPLVAFRAMERDVVVIVNPAAGGGRALKALARTQTALRDAGLRARVERTRDIEHARELAAAAGRDGAVAVAVGGDGIVGAVADGLRGTDGLMAIVPGGRGNDFARTLGIPRDPADAA